VSSVGIRLPEHPRHRRAADLERLGYVGWGPTGGLAARAGMQGSMKPLERTVAMPRETDSSALSGTAKVSRDCYRSNAVETA
jgi:hypothetical protein